MKQMVVIKLLIHDSKKSRTKAMKIGATFCGVESVALMGERKNKIKVIGEGIDAVELVRLLRKNVGSADLISVGPAKEGKIDEATRTMMTVDSQACNYYCYNCHGGGSGGSGGSATPLRVYEVVKDSYYYNDPSCSVM